MLTVRQGFPAKVNAYGFTLAMSFSADGKHVLGGGKSGVRVWRMARDLDVVATIEARSVTCLAVSKDHKWIAAGTQKGDVFMWDATTYEKVFSHCREGGVVHGVDFSPDSTGLLVASHSNTAIVWDVASHKQARSLRHEDGELALGLTAAKYSPQGNRIATATQHTVRIWDNQDGRPLANIKEIVAVDWNECLHWLDNNRLLVISDTIKLFEASTGRLASKWPVPNSNKLSCIALPRRGDLVVYSTGQTVTSWDTSAHTKLAFMIHPEEIHSIALSPDNLFLAIGGHYGEMVVTRDDLPLPDHTASIVYSQIEMTRSAGLHLQASPINQLFPGSYST